MAVILITGAGGSIGSLLVKSLAQQGHTVKTLSTQPNNKEVPQKSFLWNIKTGFIEQNAFDGIDTIIHLAGANIGKRRWSKAYKEEIIRSRVDSTAMLLDAIIHQNIQLKTFIGMSGSGYYEDPSKIHMTESSPQGSGFVSEVCKHWELATESFNKTGARVVIMRTAPVLMRNSGLLPAYLMTARLRVIPTTGSPNAKVNWIHPDDLLHFFAEAITDETYTGTYNVCSPGASTQLEFVKAIDRATGKWHFHPNVPPFLLKAVLGERAALPLSNHTVIPERLKERGFRFRFGEIDAAINSLMNQHKL